MILDVDFIHNKQSEIELIEKQRGKFDNFAKNEFYKAFMASYRVALDKIEMAGSIEQIKDVQAYIDAASIKKAYNDVYQTVGKDFAAKTYNAVKPLAKAKDDSLKDEWSKQMERYLDTYAATRVVAVANQTGVRFKREISKTINDGIQRGLSIDDIKRNLVRSVENMTATRARVIARTEVVGASNQGSLIGAQSSGINLNKQWITAHNKVPPRPAHKKADGQTVGLYEQFTVGGEKMNSPGDVTASAENVINCRCTVIYTRKL